MRDSSGIYTVLLAALLLASCTSPACARGRSLFQMHDVHEAEMFPLFGNARLTAEQVRGMAWHGMSTGALGFAPPQPFNMHTCGASDAELSVSAGICLVA